MASMRTIREGFLSLVLFVMFFSFFILFSHAVDTIRSKEMVRDNETLVSAGGVFELGFFADGFSGSHYLGIWFKNDENKKAVWVANRENPILDSSGVLKIRNDGNLELIDRRKAAVIVNTGTLATSGNTSATLLDSGNLVLEEEGGKVIWQSFDYPTDTYLPGMKLGWFGVNTDQSRIQLLVSWVSPLSPTRGTFTLAVNNKNSTKLGVWRRDGGHMDIGFWDGQNLRFLYENNSLGNYKFSYVSNENETYFTFSSNASYVSTWFVLTSDGQFNEYSMLKGKISLMSSHSLCDQDSAGRCFTSIPSTCEDGDNFSVINGTLPTSMFVSGSIDMGFSDCEIMCRSNCSCTAFASLQDDQTGCQLYYGSKNDLLDIIEKGAEQICVRGGGPTEPKGKSKRRLWLKLIGPLASLLVLILVYLLWYWRWRKHCKGAEVGSQEDMSSSAEVRLFQLGNNLANIDEVRSPNNLELGAHKDQELPILFSFSGIETATNYFAAANKIGEGGFGPVYKGRVLQGQEIAVKRLSKVSRQGLEEFKNEVTLISQLQHRNLVRLLGCCIEAEECILVYEYMPNRSLDSFIFDCIKRAVLDWRKRVKIIEGIVQGLLYLHKYSRLRIIHRDLKTSNILLDHEMNPKISDFGLARIFGEDETRVKTNRVVGTYGYMSPEYAMDGFFSEKSDVFSFGVIVLEIVSGKKNIAFFETDHSLNLLGKAWNLWKEGKSMELMDSTLGDSCSRMEVIRCIQLGLLCVQERAVDRPTMSDVVSMLSSETVDLPLPKEPAFLTQLNSSTDHVKSSSSRQRQPSVNDITISDIYAR